MQKYEYLIVQIKVSSNWAPGPSRVLASPEIEEVNTRQRGYKRPLRESVNYSVLCEDESVIRQSQGKSLQEFLNALGQEGWQIADTTSPGTNTAGKVFFFMRPTEA